MNTAKTVAGLIYVALSCCIWPAAFFYYLCRVHSDGKYKGNYRQRLGFDPPGPFGKDAARVWFHALSVGETLSALPLIREIRNRRPGIEIIFSAATETGMRIARERLSSDVANFFYMPHDFPWAVRSLVRRVRPALFVIIETDLWPNLLHVLKREGVVTALVNGRISPGSHARYARSRDLAKMLFDCFDLVFTQTEQDRGRFESLGVPYGKLAAAGNLKFEAAISQVSESEVESIREQIGLVSVRPVWVAGSTHEGEDEIVLRVHRELLSSFPDLLLIIAPRKIERRSEIEDLCFAGGFACGIRSRGEGALEKEVYILDTLGELARIYAVCDAAFLGGSLVPFGGHNPLEAVAQGKPACWGPHFFNFQEIESALLKCGSCRKIVSERELADFIKNALLGADRLRPGTNPVCGLEQGVAGRVASALLEKIPPT